MTKKERKLLTAAEKLEKVTQHYLEELMEIDEVFQNLPAKIVRGYNLEQDYFQHIPTIASASVNLELLKTKLYRELLDV